MPKPPRSPFPNPRGKESFCLHIKPSAGRTKCVLKCRYLTKVTALVRFVLVLGLSSKFVVVFLFHLLAQIAGGPLDPACETKVPGLPPMVFVKVCSFLLVLLSY